MKAQAIDMETVQAAALTRLTLRKLRNSCHMMSMKRWVMSWAAKKLEKNGKRDIIEWI